MGRLTNYQKGYRLELLAKRELIAKGYYVVRSAGSHGACDLIALNQKEILLIQVGMQGAKDEQDFELLRRVPAPKLAQRQMWIWIPRVGWQVELVELRP